MADDGTARGGPAIDDDGIADRVDETFGLHNDDRVRETLFGFLGKQALAALEVGCGSGHWLTRVARAERSKSAATPVLVGLDPSAAMLVRAKTGVPEAHFVRAVAERLPWRDGSLDRVFCVNALHLFADRLQFFAEARRVLKPGGGLLTIGMDPHTERDSWWVYDYFEPTREIDRARFARVRTLRGELTRAGFSWSESFEADHIETLSAASDLLEVGAAGPVARRVTSQLTLLPDDDFNRGMERIRSADAEAGNQLQLVADVRLYATVGWV